MPAKIVQVADIPRTKSGKIVELAVRDRARPPVKNIEALANPEALAELRIGPSCKLKRETLLLLRHERCRSRTAPDRIRVSALMLGLQSATALTYTSPGYSIAGMSHAAPVDRIEPLAHAHEDNLQSDFAVEGMVALCAACAARIEES